MSNITIDKMDDACIKYKNVQNSNVLKFAKLGDWLDKESSIFENEIASQDVSKMSRKYPKFKRGGMSDYLINIYNLHIIWYK